MPRHPTGAERTCAVCRKPFVCKEGPAKIARGAGKFCGRACQGQSKRVADADKFLPRTCPVCGTPFGVRPSEASRGGGIFCSLACRDKGAARPKAERFWEKVNKDGPVPPHRPELGPCWLWTAATKQPPWDYGILGTPAPGEAGELAHRVSWELHHGPIPDGAKVLHHCDVPRCVNPAHLFLGSLADNARDMLAKRRHKVVLTLEQVADLRARYAAGGVSQTTLAREFGIAQVTVSRIVRHRNTY
jgi:hypothetical protein